MSIDDIDDRAAHLLARLDAERKQREAPHPEPEPGPEPEPQAETHQPPAVRRMAPPPWQRNEPMSPEPPPPPESPPPPPALPGSPPMHPAGWAPPPPWFPPPPGWKPRMDPPHAAPPGPAAPVASNAPLPSEVRFSAPEVPPLDDAADLHNHESVPATGWRRFVHQATGGRLNPGASAKDRTHQQLLAQIRQPIVGDFRIAVLSVKGGVGKTTTTVGLGSALAMVRDDRIIAVDANPDRGTLAERIPDTSTTSTVRDLLRDPNIHRYADVRSHTRMSPSRLEVLASEQDPEVAEVFGEADYRRTMEILSDFYNVILTDCGTGIMHSSMAAVLDMAHTIVLVSSPAIDAARSASATLDWLAQHGHGVLAREAHVVLSGVRRGGGPTERNVERIHDHFAARCGSVHTIPFEPHLAAGTGVDFAQLSPATVQSYLELAGAVAEKFVRLRG